MTDTIDVTIRLDRNLIKNAEHLFETLGMNLSTATTVFLEQAVREECIPFNIESDSFWSKKNQERLEESLHELRDGKVVIKTTAELEAMEKEEQACISNN